MSKRKAHAYREIRGPQESTPFSSHNDPSLFIQAHEADIVRGPRGHASSLALEVRRVDGQLVVGEELMEWNPRNRIPAGEGYDKSSEKAAAIWVDRYVKS